MADRSDHIDSFIESAGWRGARRKPLAGDASFRRYERITMGGETAVIMDAPPPREDVRPFVHMTGHLLNLGYSAPRIYAEDRETGLLLLEDLGDDLYTAAIAKGAGERELYERAVDLLIDLHSRPPAVSVPDGLAEYDEEMLLDEAALFTDWYMPNTLHAPTPPRTRTDFLDIWRRYMPMLEDVPETLTLRDYHADNLIWLPGREGVAAVGLLDYQDAVAGRTPYDLMSLLEDARRDLPPGFAGLMLDRYLGAFPDQDRRTFEAAYAILAAQRHCKVIGIFTRLAYRDGKFAYLKHIPRVWRLLTDACRHPVLGPLQDWLDAAVPLSSRTVPAQQRRA